MSEPVILETPTIEYTPVVDEPTPVVVEPNPVVVEPNPVVDEPNPVEPPSPEPPSQEPPSPEPTPLKPTPVEDEPTPVVDSSNIEIGILTERTFIDLLKIAISNEGDIGNNISIKLTPSMLELINNIITISPGSLSDIEKSVQNIVKDGKIETNDVPGLIVIIQSLYRLIYSFKNTKLNGKLRAEATSTTLKFIIHLLVLERKIVIENEKQSEFLKTIGILIDNCVELLILQNTIKQKNCFKKLFG
jgi:hypothetical protein